MGIELLFVVEMLRKYRNILLMDAFNEIDTKPDSQLVEAICAATDEPNCFVLGPVLREQQGKDTMK